jgi:DDE superfamily endonuclease
MLDIVTSEGFYSAYVRLPQTHTSTPSEIRNNSKLYPFFKHCDGAIDGSHIDAWVSEEDAARFRNRKGRLTQNILAACTFDLRFSYILSGWEGSASDSQVFDNARRIDFGIRPGKFYLADAGFPACDTLLVPYRGVRYHLKEWGRVSRRSVLLFCMKV